MPKWNTYTERYLSRLSRPLKRKRVEQFVRMLGLGPTDIILDLGSEAGSYLASYYPYPHNVILADISEERLQRGVAQYGLKDYVLLNADGPIPVRDNCFDAIW
ncbi:MAG: hypothetical protein IID41_06250 [Planctomycetes bacterium]|nr:hypothetical protein [Planctomycetota bacterium]